ncbi:uncharacterized protein EHS24_005383 [Apiotrichum porosum]|uniref:Ricin B lectin domain-containing protein n=1 Tax=Apiotrichum porosum TaxID=105984 RepID=A0A427XCV5_9TREE|nr:uncharacterized protein EHS24_005383 [Apiotrichum porosum]RSH76637.1 hypothetical protein EHS24_005383 [Apiotrichum porosum]
MVNKFGQFVLGLLGTNVASKFSITVGSLGSWTYPDDTAAASFIDKDGTYYFQQSDGEYAPTATRVWSFFTGFNIDDAKLSPLTHSVNPNNPLDSNGNTTWRCNNSPTGRESTYAPNGPASAMHYSQRNFCDLMGVWIDPDTGDWHGLVHNEFTPQPFGDNLHYDAIDYTVSQDQGKTWNISHHIITSPYPTVRGDNKTFPHETYYYGDGDPRLIVDVAGGYFYATYGSRVISKGEGGWWTTYYTHAARAPLSGKLARGWQKWYAGSWSEPGIGGKESNIVPVSDDNQNGYTAPEDEYSPLTPGTAPEQIAAGKMPPTSALFWMDVSYNAYLGLWIGEPNNLITTTTTPQEFYATDDLSTQKWTLIGDTGDAYLTKSAYRFLLDDVSKSSSTIIGKNFRAYCSYGCSTGNSEFVHLAIDGAAAVPVDTSKRYVIRAGGQALDNDHGVATSTHQGTQWTFAATGDGAYTIISVAGALGVSSQSTKSRAWGSSLSIGVATGDIGQQWWVLPDRSGDGSTGTGEFRIVNRFSGLYLALSGDKDRLAEATPGRSWTDKSGSKVGGGRRPDEQTLTLVAV